MRKRLEFDAETWHALHFLGRDTMKSLQELADEAFRDLLRKHRRLVSLCAESCGQAMPLAKDTR